MLTADTGTRRRLAIAMITPGATSERRIRVEVLIVSDFAYG